MRTRVTTLAGGIALALAVGAGALAATPAVAAPAPAPALRVVPVIGSGHYLVYGVYSPVTSGKTTVTLRSLDSNGRTRSLGTVETSTPTAIPATAAGAVVVVAENGSQSSRWDLGTGSRTTVPAQAVAAPGGYAAMGSNGKTGADARQTVVLVTPTGTTQLGVPFPRNENVDGSFHLSSGSAGVTVTDGNGHVRYIAFTKPGTVRSLTTVGGGASLASLTCSSFTATSVACSAFDEETTTLLSIRLDGSRVVRATPDCVTAPAALRTAIAWVGCKDRLEVLHANRTVSRSTARFGDVRPVSAFGKVVLQSRSGTALQTMTRSGSAPRTIVSVAK